MSRVFTINFRFKEQLVSALVNLRDKDYNLSFQVRYLDKEVAELVPGGRIEFSLSGFSGKGEIKSGRLGEELLFSTSEAITNYLQSH
jgi:hypothetical protein